MVSHKKLHSCYNDYTYVCDICGKRFPQRCSYRRHKLTHGIGDTSAQSKKTHSQEISHNQVEAQSSTSSVDSSLTKLEQTVKSETQNNNSPESKYDEASHKYKETFERKCRFCDLDLDTKEDLTAHILTHTGPRPFVCTQCEQTFTERSSMLTHKKLHLGPNAYRYECNLCGRRFARGTTLVRHKLAHSGEKPFSCKLCEKSFATKYTLKSHTLNVHFKTKTKPTYKKTRVAVFVPSELEENGTSDMMQQNVLTCDKCGQSFNWHSSLISHKINHHGLRPYQCDVCGKTFPRKSVLRLHIFSHSNYKPHTCDDCGKLCSTRSSLNWHKKTHSHDLPYPCEICGKCFKLKSYANNHMKLHSTSRELFECPICSKTYATKSGLDAHHLRLHASEDDRKKKEYQCQWCSFVCYDRNYLHRHSVTHTGQKDHMCEVCGRAFSFEYSLKRHRLMHVSSRNYQCPMCDKSYFIQFDLHRHMRMHSDERPFQCEHCAKCFKTSDCLSRHIKKVHTKNITMYVF